MLHGSDRGARFGEFGLFAGLRRERLEFGGAPGVLAIMTLSHMVAYYVLLCVAKREGRLYPLPLDAAAFAALLADLRELAVPVLAHRVLVRSSGDAAVARDAKLVAHVKDKARAWVESAAGGEPTE